MRDHEAARPATFVPVSIPGFAVTEGEELAIVLSSADVDGYFWKGDLDWPYFDEAEGTYAGGLAYDQGPDATVSNGEGGYTEGSDTWTDIFLYNSPGITSGPNADFGFEVFENAPEPSSWMLAAGALLAFFGIKASTRLRLRQAALGAKGEE